MDTFYFSGPNAVCSNFRVEAGELIIFAEHNKKNPHFREEDPRLLFHQQLVLL